MKQLFSVISRSLKQVWFNKKYIPLMLVLALIPAITILYTPTIYADVIDFIGEGWYTKAALLLPLYVIMLIIRNGGNYFYRKTWVTYVVSSDHILRKKFLEKTYSLPLSLVSSDEESSKLLNTNETDIHTVVWLAVHLIDGLINVSMFVYILFSLFFINLYVGSLVAAICLVNFVFANIISGKIAKATNYSKTIKDQKTPFLLQMFKGMPEIKSYNLQDKFDNKYADLDKLDLKSYKKQVEKRSILLALVPMINDIIFVALLGLSVLLVSQGQITLAEVLVLMSYYSLAIARTGLIRNIIEKIKLAEVSLDRLESVLNFENPNIQEFGDNTSIIKGDIVFHDVSFRYKDEGSYTLKDLDLTIPENKVTAIVGASNAGKTTILNLLLRLYSPQKGCIKIGKNYLNDFNEESFTMQLGLVEKTPFLFNMSIKDNLTIVNPDTDEMVKICKELGIHRLIKSLPNGYNTIITENSFALSYSQRQTLCIARALISKTRFLLFDEVAALLDGDTSKELMNKIYKRKSNHTIVVVSQSLHQIDNADNIIVLGKGKVVATGTHKELIKNCTEYIELHKNFK